jgi:hypothetical protein
MYYKEGNQTRDLKDKLLESIPINATIIGYEYYGKASSNERGWVMIWRIACKYVVNFHRRDDSG